MPNRKCDPPPLLFLFELHNFYYFLLSLLSHPPFGAEETKKKTKLHLVTKGGGWEMGENWGIFSFPTSGDDTAYFFLEWSAKWKQNVGMHKTQFNIFPSSRPPPPPGSCPTWTRSPCGPARTSATCGGGTSAGRRYGRRWVGEVQELIMTRPNTHTHTRRTDTLLGTSGAGCQNGLPETSGGASCADWRAGDVLDWPDRAQHVLCRGIACRVHVRSGLVHASRPRLMCGACCAANFLCALGRSGNVNLVGHSVRVSVTFFF